MLVRIEARQRDMAIRAALGAGWSGVAKLVFSEAAVLTLVAAGLGLSLAHAALPGVLALGIVDLPRIMRVEIDGAVLGFTAVALLAAVGVLTVIPMTRLVFSLGSGSAQLGRRSPGVERDSARTRHVLLVAQVAIALLPLAGAGLMIRTFLELSDVEPGFTDPAEVQTFQIELSAADAESIEQAVRTHHAIVDRLAALPGVEGAAFAAFTDALPMDGDGRSAPILAERAGARATPDYAEISFVSPGYYGVLSTELMAGRGFEWDDVYGERRVALISETFARAAWGTPDAAVGERISLQGADTSFEIVGVTRDIRHDGLTLPAPRNVSVPIPVGEGGLGTRVATFAVRSARAGTSALVGEIAQAVWQVNGNVSLANVRTLGELYEQSMARTTLALTVLLVTGSVALVLAFVGIYGVYSYAVSKRAHEIGIRMALGAAPAQLRRMIVKHALALTGIGITIGVVLAITAARLASTQLFGVSPLDPPTYAASALVLALAAGVASYLPARRASALDPQAVLSTE
jgi:predicted permease